jgi:predicted secreted hydrolase
MSDKQARGGMRSRAVSAVLFCLVLAALSHPRSLTLVLETSPAWREAAPGYQFTFPRDHGAHMDSRIEWWYYTGNLETKSGRRFGYQLTFFRVGVVREQANSSRWALRDLYMAHFAISDIESRAFHSFERINRAGIGWAGADTLDRNSPGAEQSAKSTVRVWNEDWDTRIENGSHTLRAADDGFSIAMKLTPSKPEVVHGEKGISQKGPTAGNASHYYSLTRLESSGLIEVEGESFDVSGLSWMDHEFGTSFLDDQQTGWDWFSIHLQDGRDLMLFEIRRRDGSIDSRSSGTLIDAGGNAIHLSSEDFSLKPGQLWRSSKSGANYPTEWKIDLPGYGLLLNVTAEIEDQELHTPESTGVTYWEGSVSIRGADGDKPIRGAGYLEMTGYAGANMSEVLR